ncbi:MAG: hypothetical protein M1840_002417 [Geoglossum simile]|nr:MAG: hypothetical protein M1840_002417 [Geoglossum simile]
MYTIQPESWILDVLFELLKKFDHDLSYRSSTKNIYFHKLIDIEKKFNEGDAKKVLPECLISEIPLSSKSIKSDVVTVFIECEVDYFRSLTEYSKYYTEALKDYQGNQTVISDLPSIWASFKDKPDVNSTRLYAINIHRYSIIEMMAKD